MGGTNQIFDSLDARYIRALAQSQEDSDEQLEAKERQRQRLEVGCCGGLYPYGV